MSVEDDMKMLEDLAKRMSDYAKEMEAYILSSKTPFKPMLKEFSEVSERLQKSLKIEPLPELTTDFHWPGLNNHYCALINDIKSNRAKIKEVYEQEQEQEVTYIPKDLEDSFVELKKILDPKLIEDIENMKEEVISGMHHGLGRHLRNNWGLWNDSVLAKWFNEKGIHHADDMSGIILDSFWRHLHSEPIKLDEQIKFYQYYWEKTNND